MEQVVKKRRGHLYTVDELAETLSVPKSWVYARTASNEIPHIRVGRYVRFSVHEVMRWLGVGNDEAQG